jgi:hypothetical protein
MMERNNSMDKLLMCSRGDKNGEQQHIKILNAELLHQEPSIRFFNPDGEGSSFNFI